MLGEAGCLEDTKAGTRSRECQGAAALLGGQCWPLGGVLLNRHLKSKPGSDPGSYLCNGMFWAEKTVQRPWSESGLGVFAEQQEAQCGWSWASKGKTPLV